MAARNLDSAALWPILGRSKIDSGRHHFANIGNIQSCADQPFYNGLLERRRTQAVIAADEHTISLECALHVRSIALADEKGDFFRQFRLIARYCSANVIGPEDICGNLAHRLLSSYCCGAAIGAPVTQST